MSSMTAPVAPGTLGEAIGPQALLSYLGQLTEWTNTRRRELDELDAASQQSPLQAQLTSDVILSMALWQAVRTRLDQILTVWDSGRVGIPEREKISTLIWGRLDTAASTTASLASMNVSLPEACRLSDALASSLRGKLALDPEADEITARITTLRASIERLRDQVQLEPGATIVEAQATLATIIARLDGIVDKVSRGGDVGGFLAPLEQETATFERDLIVAGTQRRTLAAKRSEAELSIAALTSREEALTQLVARVRESIDPAPKYAVPHVAALGPIPATDTELTQFLHKLDTVGRAMAVVEEANAAALQERDALCSALDQARTSLGAAPGDDATQLLALAESTLAKAPTPMALATQLIQTLRTMQSTHGGAA